MSFLNNNNSEFLSARITQKGRNAIAKGNFNIEYFQIGDSEFDYSTAFSTLTGQTTHQKVMSPFDKESGIKYPIKLDSSTNTTTYGVPVLNPNNEPTPIRNDMGPAGFVTNYSGGTPSVECKTQTISYTKLSGSTILDLTGDTLQNCEYITLVFDTFGTNNVIAGKTNSLVYKVLSVSNSGYTLNLDRNVINLSTLSGYVQVVCNNCEQEYPIELDIYDVSGYMLEPINQTQQLNSWTMNTVWTQKPIGADYNGIDETLAGYESNVYVSTKELLGYTSTGQTFVPFNGLSTSGITITGTTYKNSFDELIEVTPSEQRCIAIIHYSELGDLRYDTERFYKYDDYISHKTGITSSDISIVEDYDRENDLRDLSDSEYFEIYIPFIYYHRNTGTTMGARFFMDTTDYYVKSTKNAKHQLLFRFLVDEQNNKVGKVFVKNKIVVFDDQELVAILDYRSNRKYTLPAPKISTVPSDTVTASSLLTSTGQTAYVTYVFANTSGTTMNALPCNYYSKITGTTTPSQVTMKFSGNTSFNTLKTSFLNVNDGFVADKFYALVQLSTGSTPNSYEWRAIDLTTDGIKTGLFIDPSKITGTTFTITKTQYDAASLTIFDLENHMSGVNANYLGTSSATDYNVTIPQFGDEQPFPGSIRFVRATDVEQLNFLVNLPSSTFSTSQNPTWVNETISGKPVITEISLLDSNKEPLVVGKPSYPVKRIGAQVFAIKLDF
jgi:hypothetical protein